MSNNNGYGVSGVSYPTVFPEFINNIQNEEEKTSWKGYYLTEYKKEYDQLENECYGIKATMTSVSIFAPLVFATIALFTAKMAGAMIAASVLSLNGFCIPLGICAIVYYACKADQNSRDKNALPQTFPLKFQVVYENAKIAIQKQFQAQAQLQTIVPLYVAKQ